MKVTSNSMWRLLVAMALVAVASCAFAASPSADFDEKMQKLGLTEVVTLDPSIAVDLRYATTQNFAGKNMYGSLRRAYLAPSAAKALVKAQAWLKSIDPAYSLVIYDAARPRSVQQTMWNTVKGTEGERYVARPERGGPHNYGIAVDVGLTYNGKAVDMGTEFDSFSTAAHITDEATLVAQGRITKVAKKNRELLRKAMTQAGFMTYRREWWHFEWVRVKTARAKYKLLDF